MFEIVFILNQRLKIQVKYGGHKENVEQFALRKFRKKIVNKKVQLKNPLQGCLKTNANNHFISKTY